MGCMLISPPSSARIGETESYGWIIGCGFVLTLVIAGYSVTTYLDQGEPFRAALCFVSQLMAIACAVMARRAFLTSLPIMGWAFAVAALGCAYWSAQGLQNAWIATGAEANVAAVWFIAALEPGLFLGIEHVRDRRLVSQIATSASVSPAVAAPVAVEPINPGPAPRVATPSKHPPLRRSQERAAIIGEPVAGGSARERAIAIRSADPGISIPAIAKRVGYSRSQVWRWIKDASATGEGEEIARAA